MEFLKRLFSLVAVILTSPLTGGRRLKYGNETINEATVSLTMDASITLTSLSSYFVSINASGNGILTVASDNYVFGHLIAGQNDASSSTAGATSWGVNVALDAIYRVPVSSGTYSRASNRGVPCDLAVATNVQGAAIGTNTKHHLCVLDGDETNNYWIIARINPAVIGQGQS
jgi:hypothetical protein